MASANELRKQIGSIKNTQKITSAMEMVAASRMKKTQEQMARGRPYSDHMRYVIGHVANASTEYRHQFMREREVKRIGYIVVTKNFSSCILNFFNFGDFADICNNSRKHILSFLGTSFPPCFDIIFPFQQ